MVTTLPVLPLNFTGECARSPPSLLMVLACLLWAGVGVREAMADGAGMCVAFM